MKKALRIISITLLTVLLFLFAGCAPTSVAQAKNRMENEGYTVTVETLTGSEAGGFGSVILLEATKNDDQNCYITAFLFKSTKDARTYKKRVPKSNEGKFVYKRKGKWVYYAHPKAERAFNS